MKKHFAHSDNDIEALHSRMKNFYDSVDNYSAFQEPNSMPEYWQPIREVIQQCIKRKGYCKVLEFGAGMTGFSKYLGDIRSKITFDVQDITDANQDYLLSVADNVYIGDITQIKEYYDIIFSTFVWEHLSQPKQTLDFILQRLNSDGSIFLASPRYDLPFYFPPSGKHLSLPKKVITSIWLLGQRVKTHVARRPQFLIHMDPACLHVNWFRDADAIHWASIYDLTYALPKKFSVTRLRLQSTGIKGLIWEKACLLFVRIYEEQR